MKSLVNPSTDIESMGKRTRPVVIAQELLIEQLLPALSALLEEDEQVQMLKTHLNIDS
jgi:hypothetical protein